MAVYLGSTPVSETIVGGSAVSATPVDEIHVRDFLTGGDKPDGNSDLAYAVQAAVDEATGSADYTTTPRTALGQVVLPFGRVPVTTPIRVRSVLDLDIRGYGAGTKLQPAATGMECVLDLNGTAYSSFRDFMVVGSGSYSCTRAVWVRWNGAYRSSTQNEFRNIKVRDLRFTDAFQVGDPANAGVQVDQTNWYNCLSAGQSSTDATLWRSGFHFGEGTYGNNVIHSAFGCGAIRHKWNVYVDACQLGWWGGIVQAGAVDFFLNSSTYFHAAGFRSENSGRLVETGGPATFSQQVTFDDVDWHCEQMNADGYFAKVRCGGVYKFRNVQIPKVTGKTPKIIGDGAGHQLIEIDGVTTTTPAVDLVAGTSTNGQVKIRSHVQIDSSGATSALTVN